METVLTALETLGEETPMSVASSNNQSVSLSGFFLLPQQVTGEPDNTPPWVSPFEHLTGTNYSRIDYTVTGTVSTAGYHYWAHLNTQVRSGHDKWQVTRLGPPPADPWAIQETEVSIETRYGQWEFAAGSVTLVIVP